MYLCNKMKLLAVLGVLVSTTPSLVYAQCPDPIKPQVIVKVGAAEVKHDYTKSSSELIAIADANNKVPFKVTAAKGIDLKKAKGIPIADRVDYMNGAVTGLYMGKPSVEVAAQFETTTFQKTKSSCMRVKTILVDMKLYPEIYVTRDANYRNTKACFNTILEHEKMHDKITKKIMLEYKDIMQQNIVGISPKLAMIGPFSAAEKKRMQNQVTQAIVNKATQIMTLMIMEDSKQQQQFHTSDAGRNDRGCKKVNKQSIKQVKNSNLHNR